MIVNPKAFGQSGVGHSSLWPISYLRNLCLKVTICHPQPTNPPGNPNPPVSPFSTKAQPVPPSTHNAWQHEPTWNFERRRARVNVPFWELDGEGWLGGELSRWPYLLEPAVGEWMCPLFFWGGFNSLQKQGLLTNQNRDLIWVPFQVHPGNKWFVCWWSSRERSHLRTLRL